MPASKSQDFEPRTRGCSSVSLFALPGIPLVAAGDDLALLIAESVERGGERLRNGDILVIAQKIVSKAEGRSVDLANVRTTPEAEALAASCEKDARQMALVLQESDKVLRARPGVVVVAHRRGWILANAGIDRSNVDAEGRLLLLPENPDASAAALRTSLAQRCGASVGVIIADSIGRAWRLGTVGTAIGASGVACLQDLRGRPDIFGRPLETTEVGHADELAAAASLLMGQAGEQTPVVLIRGVRGVPAEGKAADLIRPQHLDMFR